MPAVITILTRGLWDMYYNMQAVLVMSIWAGGIHVKLLSSA